MKYFSSTNSPVCASLICTLFAAWVEPATAQNAAAVFAKVSPSVVMVRAGNSQGSGIAVAVESIGFGKLTTVVTNCHVVEDKKQVTITHKATAGAGTVKSCDPVRDIAIVSVVGELPTVQTRSVKNLIVGEPVFAVGAPKGFDLSISEGIISQLRLMDTELPMVQTTAAISVGSSGGGLFDMQGRLIGITSFIVKESQALNFAFPADWISQAIAAIEPAKASAVTAQPVRPVTLPPSVAGADARYSKISNTGALLSASAALGQGPMDWACVRDNQTGWTWEVKTSAGLRSMNHIYSWYDPRARDGNPGEAGGGFCETPGRCDTEKYVADVNTAGLCGAQDWRLPTIDQLKSLVRGPQSGVAVDAAMFPNTRGSFTWSTTPNVSDARRAWNLNFGTGLPSGDSPRGDTYSVRLIRSQ